MDLNSEYPKFQMGTAAAMCEKRDDENIDVAHDCNAQEIICHANGPLAGKKDRVPRVPPDSTHEKLRAHAPF
ncbi:hypothetical protein WA026_018181 [Henosepilachna vigintioctopunctata]|uniref:Uncharacterized protein n=1 Tax=Henosepilachna vigintioctopunctata TaxID=420089 RepID=A0AAW1UNA7_9CUCU